METQRKITVYVPEDLLRRAQESTGKGITATIRRGLEMLSASKAYEELLKLRGKIKFSTNLKDLREDRR